MAGLLSVPCTTVTRHRRRFYLFDPGTLKPLGRMLKEIPEEDTVVCIDGGLHGADLWDYLGRKKSNKHWKLIEVSRPEQRRAELGGRLRVAYERESFNIVRGLEQQAGAALQVPRSRQARGRRRQGVVVTRVEPAVVDRRRKLHPSSCGPRRGTRRFSPE